MVFLTREPKCGCGVNSHFVLKIMCGLEVRHIQRRFDWWHFMSNTMIPAVDLNFAAGPDAEVDREILTETLFGRIAQCDDDTEIENLRGQIVAINMQIAQSLARRYFGHGENNDDLEQVAYVGLTKAARGFHIELGHNFLSYAVPTITGELKKHFRDHCWTVRPPRRIQDLQRNINAVRPSINQNLGRQPTTDELASELDIPVSQVTEALAARGCFTPVSLDIQLTSHSATTLADMICDESRDTARVEARLMLESVIGQLAEADQEILSLRFFEEWTQEQIAKKLGTSQMQISRRLGRLMRELRTALEPAADCA